MDELKRQSASFSFNVMFSLQKQTVPAKIQHPQPHIVHTCSVNYLQNIVFQTSSKQSLMSKPSLRDQHTLPRSPKSQITSQGPLSFTKLSYLPAQRHES